MTRWLVDPETGFFFGAYAEPHPVPDGQVSVMLLSDPDVRTERFSGDTETPIRAATSEEIAAYDSDQQARLDGYGQRLLAGQAQRVDDDLVVSAILSAIDEELGAAAGTMRTRVLALLTESTTF